MKKALLIGLIVCVLAMGGIGAAFATGISGWSNIGVLARGGTNVPSIGVDHMGYVISSGITEPAALVGVTLSFTKDVPKGSVIFISVRDDGLAGELAYYAGNTGGKLLKSSNYTFRLYNMSNVQYVPGVQPIVGDWPNVAEVTNIVVTVAGNSTYNTP